MLGCRSCEPMNKQTRTKAFVCASISLLWCVVIIHTHGPHPPPQISTPAGDDFFNLDQGEGPLPPIQTTAPRTHTADRIATDPPSRRPKPLEQACARGGIPVQRRLSSRSTDAQELLPSADLIPAVVVPAQSRQTMAARDATSPHRRGLIVLSLLVLSLSGAGARKQVSRSVGQ